MASEFNKIWSVSRKFPSPQEWFRLFEMTGWNEEYEITESDAERIILGNSIFVGAYHQARLVGTSRINSDGCLYATLHDVIVHPSWRGKGIASAMIDEMKRICREKGVRTLQLFAAEGTLPFYEKIGFIARNPDRPGMQIRIAEPGSTGLMPVDSFSGNEEVPCDLR